MIGNVPPPTQAGEPPASPPPRPRPHAALYAGVAAVVVAIVVVALLATRSSHKSAKAGAAAGVGPGPYVFNPLDANDPHNRDSHWHAALGVYDCDHWVGDNTGPGIWNWPNVATINGQAVPGRAGTNFYAGLHSHDDGIIHMEPDTEDDAGVNATVGRYFEEGGWKLSAGGFTFLGVARANGATCNGQRAQLTWFVNGKQHSGDPASYKLYNADVVVIAFERGNAYPGSPPSAANLPKALGAGEPSTPPTTVPVHTASGKACVAEHGATPAGAPHVPVPAGPPPTTLVIRDLRVGTGAVVPAHGTAGVDYVGVSCSTGAVFDSSYSRHQAFDAQLGAGAVIPGWDQGIPGMRVGGVRLLGIPPALAYGAAGYPPAIAPNETLWFVVTVKSVGGK